MRRCLVPIALLALAACKDDKPQTAAEPKGSAPDAGKAGDALSSRKSLLPPADPPPVATAEGCQSTATYATPMFRVAGEALQVPADRLDAVAQDLAAAFREQCGGNAWPAGFLACLDASPPDLHTYRRCFERLPAARRTIWNARLDEIVGAAGGNTYPPPPPSGAQGTTFEELCPVFVAEVARFDRCAGAMYLPKVEEVFAAARQAQVDDLIPTDAQPAIKALCTERAAVVRESASHFCQ